MDDNSDPNRTLSDPFLEDAKSICSAAYKEIMTIAYEAKTWVNFFPNLGDLKIFHSQPPCGMRVELSIESAVIPVAPHSLLMVMMRVERWASVLSPMVSKASDHIPLGVLSNLITASGRIQNILMVDAEFQLPTPFAQRRKFRFLRYLRKIRKDMWAIVDLSVNYFPYASHLTSDDNCRRRPSGLILRRHKDGSEVIWIENMEVLEWQMQYGIYVGIINSNMAFCAKVWLSTFICELQRNFRRRLVTARIIMSNKDRTHMVKATELMKKAYLDIVRGTPDETKWTIIRNQDVRVMKYEPNPSKWCGLINYVAVTSFRVQVEPLSLFNILVKSLRLQRSDMGEHELVKSVSGIDDSYCITLYEKEDGLMLQEASANGVCFFIISTPMALKDINSSIYGGRVGDALLLPSGFGIMANGSDASLVTIAFQRKFNVQETDQAVDSMRNLIDVILREIQYEISTGAEHLVRSMQMLNLSK